MKYKFTLAMLFAFVVATAYSQITPAKPAASQSLLTPSGSTIPKSSNPSALFFKSYQLWDGDSICLTPTYPSYEYCSYEKKIVNKYYNKIVSESLLWSYDIKRHANDLLEMMQDEGVGLYSSAYRSYNALWRLFYDDYFRDLIKVRELRRFGYGILTDMIVEFCQYFPKDFKVKMTAELREVQIMISRCSKRHYECVPNSWGGYDLYLDGRSRDDIAYSLEGMIARRICLDGIPASEMYDAVTRMLDKVNQVNVDNNADVLYKVSINNELSYCIGLDGPYFISEKYNIKTVPFDNRDHLTNFGYYGQKLFYNYDYNDRYYRICNERHYNGVWEPLYYYFDDVRELVITAEGRMISRTKTDFNDR